MQVVQLPGKTYPPVSTVQRQPVSPLFAADIISSDTVSLTDKKTATAKLWAALEDYNPEALEKALQEGADPEDTTTYRPHDDFSPLGYLAFNWDPETLAPMLQSLVKHGADINKPGSRFGDTPLSMAMSRGILSDKFVPVIKAFLDNGADPKVTADHGFTPLNLLVREVLHAKDRHPPHERDFIRNNVMEAAKLMIAHGADVNVRSAKGVSPILAAFQAKDQILMDFLTENGAIPDKKGYLKTKLGKGLWYVSLPFVWVAFVGAVGLCWLKGEKFG